MPTSYAFNKPIRQARHRLWLIRWLGAWSWCLAGAAGLFVLALLVQRCFQPVDESGRLIAGVAGGLVLASLLAAAGWTWWTRESLPVAAARLDEAAALRERLSTGWYCAGAEDPFARAVVADAERISRGLQVRRHLPLAFPRGSSYAGGGMVVALLTLWLFPELNLAGADQREEQRQQQQLVERTEAQVRPIVDRALTELAEKNPALAEAMEKMDPLPKADLQTPLDVRREMLKKVEKIGEQVEQQRNSEKLAAAEEFQKMLRRLATEANPQTAAGKLADALAKSDFKSAQAAIAELKKQLEKPAASEAERQQQEQTKAQLQKLAEKLDQAAADQRKLEQQLRDAGLTDEDIKKALEALKKQDIQALKDQLAQKNLNPQQMQQLVQEAQKRCNACQQANKLSNSLSQAAGQSSQQPGGGNNATSGSGSMAALSEAGEQLSQMEAMQMEMAQLEAALASLQQTKDQVGQCQGQGKQPGEGQGGMGPAPGQGRGGVAPEEETATRLQMEKTPVKTTAGSIISQKFVDGEQFEGEVSPEFREATISAQRDVTDAIQRESVPRRYHSSLKNYFTRGQGASDSPNPPPATQQSP